MKAVVHHIGEFARQEPPVRSLEVHRYNGVLFLNFHMNDKWSADHTTTWDEENNVSINVQIYRANVIVTIVDIIPETPEDKALFRNAVFLKQSNNKHRLQYFIVPKPENPEEWEDVALTEQEGE